MDIDKLITEANNNYQTNKYRSYMECYNDGVRVLANLIRQQLLQQTQCTTQLPVKPCGGCGEDNPKNRCIGCRHEFY